MNSPAISVAIALYNKAPYIERAMRSVLAQTGVEFEVVVVDDGSTDEGGAIVEAMEDPRIVLVRQENRGRSAARNRAIAVARGGLVAFLDADDEMGPGHLAAIFRLRRLFPRAGLFAVGYRKTFHGNFSKEVTIKTASQPAPILIDDYFAYASQGIVWSGNVAIPKSIFAEVGGFAVGETWGEDTDMWGRVALRYPLAYDPTVCNTYHCEALNRTPAMLQPRMLPFIRTATIALQSGSVPSHLVESLREYVSYLWLDLCYYAIDGGARRDALRILRKELTNSRSYARTAWFIERFLCVAPLPMTSFTLRFLRSRYARFLDRFGFRLRGLTCN